MYIYIATCGYSFAEFPKLLCNIKVLGHIIYYIKDFVIHDNIDNLIGTFI